MPLPAGNDREAVRTTVAVLNGVCGNSALSPVTEWLLDNLHSVDEVFRRLCRDLQRGVYRSLPLLQLVEGERMPRGPS